MYRKNRKFNDVIRISTPYLPEAGSFGKHKGFDGKNYKVLDWHYCRDIFNEKLYKTNLFFLTHPSRKSYSIASFMLNIEQKINIYSDYGPTQKNSIMWIRPSKWWTKNSMNRSIFTIFLRCGFNYSPKLNNFKEALFNNEYIESTSYAVRRFLAGNIIYTGNKRGWVDQFSSIDKPEINKLLIKPL